MLEDQFLKPIYNCVGLIRLSVLFSKSRIGSLWSISVGIRRKKQLENFETGG